MDKKILVYDIETMLLLGYTFRLGDQIVRSAQLRHGHLHYRIVTISYMFLGDKKPKCLVWDPKTDPTNEQLMREFDKVVDQADVLIGKNNHRFDDKHLNTQRMLNNLPPKPWLNRISDDVEKQMRKFFYAPSMSLDHWSQAFGFGGKDKMAIDDWIHIKEHYSTIMWQTAGANKKSIDIISNIEFGKPLDKVVKDGKKSLAKMIKYNMKDVTDTIGVLKKILPHVQFKFMKGDTLAHCSYCRKNTDNKKMGSTKYKSSLTQGTTIYDKFACVKCNRYKGIQRRTKNGKSPMMY